MMHIDQYMGVGKIRVGSISTYCSRKKSQNSTQVSFLSKSARYVDKKELNKMKDAWSVETSDGAMCRARLWFVELQNKAQKSAITIVSDTSFLVDDAAWVAEFRTSEFLLIGTRFISAGSDQIELSVNVNNLLHVMYCNIRYEVGPVSTSTITGDSKLMIIRDCLIGFYRLEDYDIFNDSTEMISCLASSKIEEGS